MEPSFIPGVRTRWQTELHSESEAYKEAKGNNLNADGLLFCSHYTVQWTYLLYIDTLKQKKLSTGPLNRTILKTDFVGTNNYVKFV